MLDFNRESRRRFNQMITEALALIEQNDARRFKRVQREIRLIVYDRWLMEPLPMGAYFNQAKVCLINLGRFDFNKSPKFRMATLATHIVYLATFGHLRRKKVLNALQIHKDRVEDLCRKEELRLLLKLGYDLRGFDISAYTREGNVQYTQYWQNYIDNLP